jgi:hypothetical protein
VTLAPEV